MTVSRTPRGRVAWRAWARVLGGLAILALLVREVGAGPFLDGVRAVDGSSLVMAFAIGVVTTVCSAWRWSLVASGLGVRLPLREAVAAYYRSQLLNTTLPGGVIGDVHRAVRHGLDIGDVGLGVRSVVLERVAGQTVQIILAVLLLLFLPSPVRSQLPLAVLGAAVAVVVAVVAGRRIARHGSPRWVRVLRSGVRSGVRDIRAGVLADGTWVGVVLASVVMSLGHVATFVLAARTAGVTAPVATVVPLAMLSLLAMILPLNVAGWGPREGVAAWVFAAAGLSATQGITASVTYGIFALVASLPGAGVLLVRWLRALGRQPEPVLGQGTAHG